MDTWFQSTELILCKLPSPISLLFLVLTGPATVQPSCYDSIAVAILLIHVNLYATITISMWHIRILCNYHSTAISGSGTSPEDVGSWYFLFKNLEASLSFLWHKTRTKVWASSKPSSSWLYDLRLSDSSPTEICSLAVMSMWIRVPVCRNKSHHTASLNPSTENKQ